MFRKISLAILGIALVWVAVGAPTFAGPDPLDPSPPADEAEICGNRSMADCVAILNEKLARERPTPSPPDPQVLAVLQSDSVVQAITRGLVSGRDYWVNVDSLENPRHGNEGAMVTMVFTQPIEFSGTIPTASNPCNGQLEGERVPPGNPCLQEARVYGTRQADFTGANVIHFQVDTKRGAVIRVILPRYTAPDIIQDMIKYYQGKPGGGVFPGDDHGPPPLSGPQSLSSPE